MTSGRRGLHLRGNGGIRHEPDVGVRDRTRWRSGDDANRRRRRWTRQRPRSGNGMSAMRPVPMQPEPNQESVWDYPCLPRLEPTPKRLQIVFAGVMVADSTQAWRVLETSHPPVYYLPPGDVRCDLLVPSRKASFCEWKGQAAYWSVVVADRQAPDAVYGYPAPSAAFGAIRGHFAIYAGAMDACYVDGERVTPQAGGFYGGWITRDIVGPFKGGPGTEGW